jgi:hypothetical protein
LLANTDPWGRYGGLGFVHSLFPELKEPLLTHEWSTFIPGSLLQPLRQLESRCKSQGVQLIYLLAPVLSPPLFDLSGELSTDMTINGSDWPQSQRWEYYYDDHHQTSAGAQEYSEWLAKQIVLYTGD